MSYIQFSQIDAKYVVYQNTYEFAEYLNMMVSTSTENGMRIYFRLIIKRESPIWVFDDVL